MGFDIFTPYLITILLAWLSAHIIKFVISLKNNEKQTLRSYLFISGGMPSAHSATVVAMTTMIGLKLGFGSGLFGLAALFAMITMYDALKVRRSSGEQGQAIRQLIKATKCDIDLPRVSKGHTPLEVVLGAVLGLLIGLVVFLSTT